MGSVKRVFRADNLRLVALGPLSLEAEGGRIVVDEEQVAPAVLGVLEALAASPEHPLEESEPEPEKPKPSKKEAG